VIEAAMASSAVIRADIRLEEQQALATIRAAGITPLELSPEQLAKWRLHSRAIHEALIADIGDDAQRLYDRILAGKTAFARRGRGPPPRPRNNPREAQKPRDVE